MRAHYCCDREAFQHYYRNQSGGGINYFRGRVQRGHGLGNLFRSLGRSVVPLISKGAKALGRQLLHTGAEVASDVLGGQNIGESFKIRGKQAASQALDNFLGKRKAPKKKNIKRKKRRRDIFD